MAVVALAASAFATAVLDVHGASWSGQTTDEVVCAFSICLVFLGSSMMVRSWRWLWADMSNSWVVHFFPAGRLIYDERKNVSPRSQLTADRSWLQKVVI